MKYLWIIIYFLGLIWSAINPYDRFTWWLEVFPALIAFVVLMATVKTFPLSEGLYILILIHIMILFIGGHYTYAKVPVFDDLALFFGSDRNQYDKVGHFAQGFVPALVAREIFLRKKVVSDSKWIFFLSICFCLAFSAFYELLEWFVAIISGANADAFLGTQGYVWDTQSDMAFALFGAISALTLLSSIQDRQIEKLNKKRLC